MNLVGSPAASSTGRTEQMIGALIPPAARRSRSPSPLIVPELRRPELPADEAFESLSLDMARLDGSGRFAARTLLRILGWVPGQRVDLTVVGDAVVISSSSSGRHAVGARGEVAMPEAARALLSLECDHRVLVVAASQHGVLVVHPHALVARLVAEHYRRQPQARDGDDR